MIKDYPCKLEKDGTLYIMQHYMSHFAPVFGRERKKVFVICIYTKSYLFYFIFVYLDYSIRSYYVAFDGRQSHRNSHRSQREEQSTLCCCFGSKMKVLNLFRKVSKIEFYNTQDCDEAFALIETMLTSRRVSFSKHTHAQNNEL